MTLRIGTRGSALALWQANWVAEMLRTRYPHVSPELVIIKTTGDVRQDVPLSEVAGRGVFVKEIEAALLAGQVDIAVHSAKDLPSVDPPGLTLAAFCERGDPRDGLISPKYKTLKNLPEGATVATGAIRRISQLLHVRRDLQFKPIRGNVDTRLRKLDEGEADALILSVAGLARLGRSDVVTETLEAEVSLPQVGQACVAVQCREPDLDIHAMVRDACDHLTTRREVMCERHFLSLLGGGCTAPVGAYAISSEKFLYLFALVATPDGSKLLRTRASSSLENGNAVAETAYRDLLDRGALELF